MPGDPPRRTSEPGTSPPPRTRSSSPIPVSSRSTAGARTSASGTGATGAAPATARPRPAAARGARSSTSVFQAPQPGHCPNHFGEEWPQAEQTWMEAGRDTRPRLRAAPDGNPAAGPTRDEVGTNQVSRAGRPLARGQDSKPVLCEASQNGLVRDRPQRHRAMGRSSSTANSSPAASISRTGPVILYGPSSRTLISTSGMPAEDRAPRLWRRRGVGRAGGTRRKGGRHADNTTLAVDGGRAGGGGGRHDRLGRRRPERGAQRGRGRRQETGGRAR